MPPSCESFVETKTGFSITRDGHRKDYTDQHVLGMRVCTERQADPDGEMKLAKTLHFRVSEHEWTSVETDLDLSLQGDCLRTLEQRVLQNLVDRAWQAIKRGGDVTGAGWSVNLIELVVEVDGRSTSCELQQVSAVTWHGDQLCIWHEDQRDQPMVKLPRDAENAVVLYRLLAELVNNVEPESEMTGNVGLGAVLAEFQTECRPLVPWRSLALYASVLIIVIAATLSLYQTGLCILLVLVTLLTATPLLRGHRETLTHFQRGLVWSRGGEERVLMLDQLDSLTVIPMPRDEANSSAPATAEFQFKSRHNRQLPIRMTLDAECEQTVALERRIRESMVSLRAAKVLE